MLGESAEAGRPTESEEIGDNDGGMLGEGVRAEDPHLEWPGSNSAILAEPESPLIGRRSSTSRVVRHLAAWDPGRTLV